MNPVWKPTPKTVFYYWQACAAGLLAAALVILLGGKIGQLRLALAGLTLLLAVGLSFGAFRFQARLVAAWQRTAGSGFVDKLLTLTACLALGSWLVAWTPLETFGRWYYYLQAAQPLIFWFSLALSAGLVLLLTARFGWQTARLRAWLAAERGRFIFGGLALLSLSLLAVAARYRVVGMTPEGEDYWNGAGAPVLAWQVLLAGLIGLGLPALLKRWPKLPSRWVDVALFGLIWVLAAGLWAREPVRPDFLVTEPVAPNFENYPDYDARNFDIMSQFALLGQKLNNGAFFDRTLYPALLVYLHTWFGQDYQTVMAWQAALYALFPACLYLLGKRLHSPGAGLGLAVLLTLRGVNQIQVGNLIDTAHPKYMLTEFPTTVLLGLATLLLVRWAQNPEKDWHLAGLAGGLIGLSTLLRPHPLALLPLIVALGLWLYRRRARLWVGMSVLMLLAFLASLLPWLQFSGNNRSIIQLYEVRIRDVLQQRYPQLLEPSGQAPSLPVNAHLAQMAPASPSEKSVGAFFIDNYLNNLVTAFQSLPSTPYLLEPRVVVKKTENFWKPYWDGHLTLWGWLFTILNLSLLALGLGTAWKRARLAGLLPLLVMLVYFGVNALGRTSGGRYLVPVDWSVVVYYTLGLATLAELVLQGFGGAAQAEAAAIPNHSPERPWWARSLGVVALCATLGASLPISQKIHQPKYDPKPNDEALTRQLVSLAGAQLNLSEAQVTEFLKDEQAFIAIGQSFYPRQFGKDEGLDISVYNFYHPLPYPRTLFTLLGPKGERVIILPRLTPAEIANTAESLVLGCHSDKYIQAWAVVLTADQTVYQRVVEAPLACPLPEPSCDNNKSCH